MARKPIQVPVPFNNETDSTFYLTPEEALFHGLTSLRGQLELPVEVAEFDPGREATAYVRRARAIAVRAKAGKYYSVTVRKEEWGSQVCPDDTCKAGSKQRLELSTALRQDAKRSRSEWDRNLHRKKYLIDAESLVTLLCKHLFRDYGRERRIVPIRGLLIFSGQTGSGKTELLRRFLIRYLRQVDSKRTPPHLLTFEDPIESDLWTDAQMQEWIGDRQPFPIDYTPRQKVDDADCLQDVLTAALRQTPDAVFIGETRDWADWRELLDFAATGHLVVTTSHAGSLAECMDILLRACNANSPAGRSEVAARILGLVHIKAVSLPQARSDQYGVLTDVKTQIPALWKGSVLGQKLLMAEGLSSITPGFFADPGSEFSFGRTHFVHEILRAIETEGGQLTESKKKDLLFRCRAWDLAGE